MEVVKTIVVAILSYLLAGFYYLVEMVSDFYHNYIENSVDGNEKPDDFVSDEKCLDDDPNWFTRVNG